MDDMDDMDAVDKVDKSFSRHLYVCLTDSEVALVLRVQVAGFAAGRAVILAILAETDFENRLAKTAVFFTVTCFFRQLTNRTDEILGHGRRLARFARRRKITSAAL